MQRDLQSIKLGLSHTRRVPSSMRTLALTVALFAFLGLGAAREARAQDFETYIFFWNNTSATITFPAASAISPGSTFSGQNGEWLPCDASSYFLTPSDYIFPSYPAPGDQVLTESFPPFVSSAPHPGPAGTLAPGYVTCFVAATDTPSYGTGGSIPYTWTDPHAPTSGTGSGILYQGVINWSDPWANGQAQLSDTNAPFTCNNTIQTLTPIGFGQYNYGPLGQSAQQYTPGDIVTVNGSGC
jgi:hypothetical protein